MNAKFLAENKPLVDKFGGTIGTVLVVIGLASRHGVAAQRKAADIVRQQLALQGFTSKAPSGWQPTPA